MVTRKGGAVNHAAFQKTTSVFAKQFQGEVGKRAWNKTNKNKTKKNFTNAFVDYLTPLRNEVEMPEPPVVAAAPAPANAEGINLRGGRRKSRKSRQTKRRKMRHM